MKKVLLFLLLLLGAFSIVVYEENKTSTPDFISLAHTQNVATALGQGIKISAFWISDFRKQTSVTIDDYRSELSVSLDESENDNIVIYLWFILVLLVNFVFSNLFTFSLLLVAIAYLVWLFIQSRHDEPYYEEED